MEKMNKLKKGKKDLLFQELHLRYKEGTLTKHIVMAAPVTMNSTLDNTGFQDPLI